MFLWPWGFSRQEYWNGLPFLVISTICYTGEYICTKTDGYGFVLFLFSCSVMSNSQQPYVLQHTRLLCPSSSPRICSNSCPLSQWCHPTISSSVVPFSSSLQSFPASESFLMSWLVTSGSQSIGASASASVLTMNIQGWFPLGLTGLISLQPKGFSRVFSKTAVLQHSVFFMVQLSHPFMTTGKPYLWLYGSLSANYCLFFNTLSRFVIGFLPRSKGLLILRLKSPSAVIMKPKKIKSLCFHVFPSICHEVMEQDAMILVFECWVLSPLFHSPLLPSSRSSLGPLCFLP